MKEVLFKIGRFFKKYYGQILSHLLLLILLFLVIYPFYLLLIKSFKTLSEEQLNPFGLPSSLALENYKLAWTYIHYSFENSLFISITTTALIVFISAITAFAFERFKFPFKEVLYMAIIALMMIPGVLTITSKFTLINKLNLYDNMWGVILPTVATGLPMSIMLLRTSIKAIPNELFEAAEMDGAKDLRVFFKIVIPMVRPIIAALVIMQFVSVWNDYLWPSLVLSSSINQTIPVILVNFTKSYYSMTSSYGVPFAGYIISSLPLIVIFAVASKQFINGMTSGAFKL